MTPGQSRLALTYVAGLLAGASSIALSFGHWPMGFLAAALCGGVMLYVKLRWPE